MKLPSDFLFNKYLSKIFSNLMQREEQINNSKSKKFSREQNSSLFLQKDLSVNNLVPDKLKQNDLNLSLNIFLEYIGVQEFIAQRIYEFLNKSEKSEKLSKNDFCEGLDHLYYGKINDLIKFTFFLADYNNDGKIYKTDMKQILSYIPKVSEFSQKNYLKQINKILSIFFDDTVTKDEIFYTENEQELNFDTYQKYIEQYINSNKNSEKQNEEDSNFLNEYDNNAPYFYFITIISYIFKNLPFNPKTVEFFSNYTNKKRIKMSIVGIDKTNNVENVKIKKLLATDSKSVTKNNNFFKSTLASTTFRNNLNSPASKIIKDAEFTPKNAKNATDFDSFAEVAYWLEKHGKINKFYDNVTRDVIDEALKNIENYN
jgi:hypothetical protein